MVGIHCFLEAQDAWCITRSNYSKYVESALFNQDMSKPKRAFMPPLSALFPNVQVGSTALDFHWGLKQSIWNARLDNEHWAGIGPFRCRCMMADWQLMAVIDIHRIASIMYGCGRDPPGMV